MSPPSQINNPSLPGYIFHNPSKDDPTPYEYKYPLSKDHDDIHGISPITLSAERQQDLQKEKEFPVFAYNIHEPFEYKQASNQKESHYPNFEPHLEYNEPNILKNVPHHNYADPYHHYEEPQFHPEKPQFNQDLKYNFRKEELGRQIEEEKTNPYTHEEEYKQQQLARDYQSFEKNEDFRKSPQIKQEFYQKDNDPSLNYGKNFNPQFSPDQHYDSADQYNSNKKPDDPNLNLAIAGSNFDSPPKKHDETKKMATPLSNIFNRSSKEQNPPKTPEQLFRSQLPNNKEKTSNMKVMTTNEGKIHFFIM